MALDPDILLSCWIIETARSSVLSWRGHGEPAARAADRARILARACTRYERRIVPDFASRHADWMAGVTGAAPETGLWGWFFLERLGLYVHSFAEPFLEQSELDRMQALVASDAEQVSAQFAEAGLPPPLPAEWPSTPEVHPPGRVHTRIGILGDPHLGDAAAEQLIPAAIADLNREGVDFTVAIGDLTQSGLPPEFARAREVLDTLEAPYIPTLGNHDMWGGGDEPEGPENFAAAFGRPPYAVHETDGLRVIVVSSADPAPSPFPPFDLVMGIFRSGPNEAVAGGKISAQVGEWANGFGPDGPTFVVLHHPPYPYLGFPPLVFGLDAEGTEVVADLVRRTEAMGVICGHTHRSAVSDLDGTPVLEVPSSKEWPFGYGVVEVSDQGWSFNLRQITDRGLVEEAGLTANLLFRRYARGPDEARAFVEVTARSQPPSPAGG
ncbi:MAG: metallophosphoesterase family protein [Actinomycetota bacterium]